MAARPTKIGLLAKRVVQAQRLRESVQRSGRTACGRFPLWTEKELLVVKQHYPDRKFLERALPHRSWAAIKTRAKMLRVVKWHHVWTCTEVARLRRIYPRGSRSELQEAFPYLTMRRITNKAWSLKISRQRYKQYKPTEIPLIDEVRKRAKDFNINMRDLDALARTKGYFKRRGWRGDRGIVDYRAIGRAVMLLEGELTIHWRD